jgi:predicted nucleic acid-binding protein
VTKRGCNDRRLRHVHSHLQIIDENASPPIDPATGQTVTHCRQRVEHLISTLQKDDAKIIIPTPSLGEVMVRAQDKSQLLAQLGSNKHIRIVPFDVMAAVEFSVMQASRIGKPPSGKVKAKFDDQIVAIARVERATVIYSDDTDIPKIVGKTMTVVGIASLPLPPATTEDDLFTRLAADGIQLQT